MKNFQKKIVAILIVIMMLGVMLPGFPAEAAATGTTNLTGTTYYINNLTGSNSNTGTSIDAPWYDFTNLNSHGAFQPGDKILLARGCTWNQFMTLTGSGTADNYIQLGAYGTGDKPKIISNGTNRDRCIRITNGSFWDIGNLELGNGGQGLMLYYTTLNNEGIYIHDMFVHDFKGIWRSKAYYAPTYELEDTVGTTLAYNDRIGVSSGIYVNTSHLNFNPGQYALKNVYIDNIEGTDNHDSLVFQSGSGTPSSSDDGHSLYQNVVFNHLNFHDDWGPTHGGVSEGFIIGNVIDAVVMNSRFDNECGGQRVEHGTAAIMVGRTKNLTFVNNYIANVPDTGSPDMTGIDLEWATDTTNFRNNFFYNNAGPGLSLLCFDPHEYQKCINNEITGNLFTNNGGNSIRQFGNYLPTGTISNNLYYEPGHTFLGEGDFSQMTVNNNLSLTSAPFNSIHGFSNTQDLNGWKYQYYNGSAWVNLPNYNSSDNEWRVSLAEKAQSIGQFEQTPGAGNNSDVARVWTAPNSGKISIAGRVLKSDMMGGNGVVAKITKNGTTIWGPQVIGYNDITGFDTGISELDVKKNDIIRLEVSNNGNGSNDTTSWAPTVGYISLAKEWEFNSNTESWTANTQVNTFAYQTGGYVGGSVAGTSAQITSEANLGVDINSNKFIKIRMKNNTAATSAKVYFTTNSDATWNTAKSKSIAISANDQNYKEYTIDMTGMTGWSGVLNQLRIEPCSGVGSGIFSIDYIRLHHIQNNTSTIHNAGFEEPTATGIQYGPMEEGWVIGNSAGIQRNGSGYNAAAAPEGVQTAFIVNGGSIQQNLDFAKGMYQINFKAAKRTSYGGTQTFDVYFDDEKIGSFASTSGDFMIFQTSIFSATTGNHSIRFVGTNKVGDNTVFIDDISISSPTVPEAPTSVTAAAGNSMALISFYPPTSNGGSAITGYTVTEYPGNIVKTATQSPIIFTGLTNGISYTFTVKANNAVGSSSESAPSAAVVPSTSSDFAPPVSNSGFEMPVTSGLTYGPMSYNWIFDHSSGVQRNGSGFGAQSAPEGVQTAFIANGGTIQQDIDFYEGNFRINFKAARRTNYGGIQSFDIYLDNTKISSCTPASDSFESYSTNAFSASNGTHTIKFVGTNTIGDNTAFIDNITISTALPEIVNSGFEAPATSGLNYGPFTNGWTFDNSAGVQCNGSGFGAQNAPEGVQTAFIANGGYIQQSVYFLDGNYKIDFKAARRTSYGGVQSFDVYLDNTKIGSFTPASGGFESYSTSNFTATAGIHTIKFLGTNTTGDNTTFIDDISISIESLP